MKIFCDFHHAGLAQGIELLFGSRLGHTVYYPSLGFAEWANKEHPTSIEREKVWTLASEEPDSWAGCPRSPEHVSRDMFLDMDWDAVIISRTESQPIFKALLAEHKNGDVIKRIAVCGNQGGGYDYGWVRNLLTSDLSTAYLTPPHVHTLHYCQEIGRHFFGEFVPIKEEDLNTVNCFMNFLPSYDKPLPIDDCSIYGACPHCGWQRPPADAVKGAYEVWKEMASMRTQTAFRSYGKACDDGYAQNADLPAVYHSGALTWHFKHIEGYGFSLLQSIAAGRPVIVPERFFRYRTAGRFLIPNVTCFEVPWDAMDVCEVVEDVTRDLSTANMHAYACWEAAQGIFQWGYEAWRVEKWMDGLL